MKWMDLLENSFGTKKKDRKRYKDGNLKPGVFEASLREQVKTGKTLLDRKSKRDLEDLNQQYKNVSTEEERLEIVAKTESITKDLKDEKKKRIENPVEYLKEKLLVAQLKGSEKYHKRLADHITSNKSLDQAPQLSDFEYISERLIKMRYLSKEKEVREKQLESLRPWFNYFKVFPSVGVFEYFFLRNLLKYDLYWLDMDDGGDFINQERTKNSTKPFPTFDPDLTPEIISKMKEYMAIMDKKVETPNPNFGEEIKKAMEEGDFRLLYSTIREDILLTRINDNEVESVSKGEWLPPFSVNGLTDQDKLDAVAQNLAKATEYSRGYCLKSPGTALDYLKKGDIYLFNVVKKVKRSNRELVVNVPEIALHVFNKVDENGISYREINPSEVHGNDYGQGMKRQYLNDLEKFISQGGFVNSEEILLKFEDKLMLEQVGKRVDDFVQGGEDLSERELRFLYEVYRPISFFEISATSQTWMSSLREKRLERIRKETLSSDFHKNYHVDITNQIQQQDFAKMFNTTPDNVAICHRHVGPSLTSTFLESQSDSIEVFVCNEVYLSKARRIPKNLKVIVGGVMLNVNDETTLKERYTGEVTKTPANKLRRY